MPRDRRDKNKSGLHHAPLEAQLSPSQTVEPRRRPRAKAGRRKEGDDAEEEMVDPRMTRRILGLAHEQQQEMAAAQGGAAAARPEDDDDDLREFELEMDPDDDADEDLVRLADGGEYIEQVEEISEADELAMQQFMQASAPQRRTLADIIMEKIQEKEEAGAAGGGAMGGAEDAAWVAASRLNPKVVEAYTAVGKLLGHYSSGKLPKAFKIIPSLANWEEVLFLTEPERWSPPAVNAATRIFASNFNPRMAQRFFNLILLERVRHDISEYGRLNYHLYFALKKALYKPAAFYKGILIPLCESGDCTLREATIVGSVLAKVSIPLLHSAAALHKLAEMPYSGANSLFIRILLNKKYSLPHQVLDALMLHFQSFLDDERTLPVVWHRSLLVFVQRYKHDLTAAHKETLKAVMRAHTHHQITPEARRELFTSVSRGDALPSAAEQMEL